MKIHRIIFEGVAFALLWVVMLVLGILWCSARILSEFAESWAQLFDSAGSILSQLHERLANGTNKKPEISVDFPKEWL